MIGVPASTILAYVDQASASLNVLLYGNCMKDETLLLIVGILASGFVSGTLTLFRRVRRADSHGDRGDVTAGR